MQKEYYVRPVEYRDPGPESKGMMSGKDVGKHSLAARIARIRSIDWQQAEKGAIKYFPWASDETDYYPVSVFHILCEADDLYVLLLTRGEQEKEPRVDVTIDQGPVHLDSCLELFLAPFSNSKMYFNFEINAKGYSKIAVGRSRSNRYLFEPDALQGLTVQSLSGKVIETLHLNESYDWGVFLQIPLKQLDQLVKDLLPPGKVFIRNHCVMRMNAYKCGDRTAKPHYACWSDIRTPTPEFHCPDFFGKMIFPQN